MVAEADGGYDADPGESPQVQAAALRLPGLGLQESQVRFFCGELLSPDDTPDQLGLENDHVIEAEEVYEEDEEEENEDMDNYVVFPLVPTHADVPVVPCRGLPAGVGVHVRSQRE